MLCRCADATAPDIDIWAPCTVGWYNAVAPGHVQLPYRENTLVLLFGNSRAIWHPFLRAWKAEGSALKASSRPLEEYVELLAVQRMAHAAGLAYLSQETHLCIHPEFSTWFAIRGCVVFPGLQGAATAPPPPHCPVPAQRLVAAGEALKAAVRGPVESETHAEVAKGWEMWVAVRDVVDPGHPARYFKEQIEYHYTGEKSILEAAANALP